VSPRPTSLQPPVRPIPGTIVVAVGGNALAPPGEYPTIYDQFRHTRESLSVVVSLACEGWHIAVVHGNGPQVGDALVRNELSRDVVEPLPLGVLVASTAGWIGYMIQQSLQNALKLAGVQRQVLTVITQTVMKSDDPALSHPTKPIGHQLSPEEKEGLISRGVAVGIDKAGKARRLSPSPEPYDVVEADAVKQLVDEGKIVIAAGGGGPPVYEDENHRWEGVDAVVDKDRVAGILGRRLSATTLLILTNVDGVYRAWGTDDRLLLKTLTVGEAQEMIARGELGSGSMKPKVEAAVDFVTGGGERAVIAELASGLEAIGGKTGTTIMGERK
jgi:carbamate kinase